MASPFHFSPRAITRSSLYHPLSVILSPFGHCFFSLRKIERKIYSEMILRDHIRLGDNGAGRGGEAMQLG